MEQLVTSEQEYIDLLQKILDRGTKRGDRTGEGLLFRMCFVKVLLLFWIASVSWSKMRLGPACCWKRRESVCALRLRLTLCARDGHGVAVWGADAVRPGAGLPAADHKARALEGHCRRAPLVHQRLY
jgi:hypothetical protein